MEYDRILASRPVNAQAARQFGGGVHWVPAIVVQDCFDDLPKLKDAAFHSRVEPTWVDYRGMVFGRLTVIGVIDKASAQSVAWACRCKCGSYCARKTKSLKLAVAHGGKEVVGFSDRCGRCSYLRKLQNGFAPGKILKGGAM